MKKTNKIQKKSIKTESSKLLKKKVKKSIRSPRPLRFLRKSLEEDQDCLSIL